MTNKDENVLLPDELYILPHIVEGGRVALDRPIRGTTTYVRKDSAQPPHNGVGETEALRSARIEARDYMVRLSQGKSADFPALVGTVSFDEFRVACRAVALSLSHPKQSDGVGDVKEALDAGKVPEGYVIVTKDTLDYWSEMACKLTASPATSPDDGWRTIESAPRGARIILWSGQEIYCGHWSKNPSTNHEAWIVAEWGSEGDQALIENPTHWMTLPKPPTMQGGG